MSGMKGDREKGKRINGRIEGKRERKKWVRVRKREGWRRGGKKSKKKGRGEIEFQEERLAKRR